MSTPSLTEVSPPILSAAPSTVGFDVRRVREDFPILRQKVNGKPLVYLDNSATTQKPLVVLDVLRRFYSSDNANIHRAVHTLSQRATREYEEARHKVQRFLNAADVREVVFTRGTTESINLVANTFGRQTLHAGDEIIISAMEHHSNIVPWQMLCQQTGAVLRVVPVSDEGELLVDEYEKLLNPRTRLVSIVHLSNALGTINPIRHLIELAHQQGSRVLVDAAQSVSHLPLDVQELDCDFLAFSGHKAYGPTGIGVLYGKASLLESMPPWQGGGDMIKTVTFARTTYADIPSRFEAGTPHISGAIGLGVALDYLRSLGLEQVAAHEDQVLRRATEQLRQIPGVRILGQAPARGAVLSFVLTDPPMSTLDVGTKLDLEGIAVRTGHHCCQPLMDRFQIPGTVRASFAVYNTLAEVDQFAEAVRQIVTEARSLRSARSGEDGKAGRTMQTELMFPRAHAESLEAAAEELADLFAFLDDWSDRYQHIMELGQKLPPMPAELKTEPNRVKGCQSTVYLWARRKPATKDVVEFLADSDADIVRGLIGILEQIFSGQRAEAILAFDVEEFFARLGLDHHLSLNRRNGLSAMVQRIRQFAESAAEGASE
jgi:cysteine desulfurase/selenocysteine lyase